VCVNSTAEQEREQRQTHYTALLSEAYQRERAAVVAAHQLQLQRQRQQYQQQQQQQLLQQAQYAQPQLKLQLQLNMPPLGCHFAGGGAPTVPVPAQEVTVKQEQVSH
jgi:hypothetical protein